MNWLKNIIVLLVVIGLGVWVALTLKKNKSEIDEEAQLSLVTQSAVPVQVTQLKEEELSNTLKVDGNFKAYKEMYVISETQGRVVEVYKDRSDYVKTGDLLAKVDDEFLRIELETIDLNIKKAEKDIQRLRNLVAGEAVPAKQLEDAILGLETAKIKRKTVLKHIANTEIKSPVSGTMNMRFIDKGSVLGAGIQVCEIVNQNVLKLMVKVTEKDILKIKVGQQVKIEIDVYPKVEFKGRVSHIGIKADQAMAYLVEIEMKNTSKRPVKVGMHAFAHFNFKENRKANMLSRNALVGSMKQPEVYVVSKDSLAELRPIIIGLTTSDKVEILQGLSPEERVVTTGQINLENGTKVSILK